MIVWLSVRRTVRRRTVPYEESRSVTSYVGSGRDRQDLRDVCVSTPPDSEYELTVRMPSSASDSATAPRLRSGVPSPMSA